MSGTVQILDCTLRDGGQGLENLNSNGIKTEIFTNRDIKILPYAFLISNGIEVMAINIGNNIKKSKLLIIIYL